MTALPAPAREISNAMPESATPQYGTTNIPIAPSANGAAPSPLTPAPVPPKRRRRRPTRIASIHAWLIVGFVALILMVIFIVQNTRATEVNFLGAHAHLSLAVALLIAAIAGALLIAAAGTARITQLRRTIRKNANGPGTSDRNERTDTISRGDGDHGQADQRPGRADDGPAAGPSVPLPDAE